MNKESEKSFNKKKWLLLGGALLVLAAVALGFLYFYFQTGKTNQPTSISQMSDPTLIIDVPQKLSVNKADIFEADVVISSLGGERYPAMSMSLSFDSSRLELIDVADGNVYTLSDEKGSGKSLPQWNYNVAAANANGKINVMYVDVTAGRNAFSKDLLADGKNIVLRLKFKLKDGAQPRDILDFTVEDAIFAARDESKSLAMSKDTLDIEDGRLVLGE